MQECEPTFPSTGYPVLDAGLQIVGGLYVVLSGFAVLYPSGWPGAAGLAKFVADLKGVLAPKK